MTAALHMQAPDRPLAGLARLSWRRDRRMEVVRQLAAADCGVACLSMVLRHFGLHASYEEVRRALGNSSSGTSLAEIASGAERFALRARAFTLDIDDLLYLQRGAVLHWEFRHFVVFERLHRDSVSILDPAVGRRRVPMAAFRRSFTGVAAQFEPSERFEKRKRASSPLWQYFRALLAQRGTLGRVVLASVMLRVFGMASPLLTGLVIDNVIPRSNVRLLWVLVVGLFSIVAVQLAIGVVRAHLTLQLRTNLDTRLILGFVDHLASLPFAFFQRRSAGDLMMRISSNATIREIVTSGTLSGVLDGVSVGAYLILLVALDARLALLAGGLGLLNVAVFLGLRRQYRELMAESLDAQAKEQSYLVQLFAGIETLKSSGVESRAVERWCNLWVDELNLGIQKGRLSAMVDAIQGVLGTATPLAILLYGAHSVMAGGSSLGGMLAMNALAMNFLGPLRSLASGALRLQDIGSYVDRIEDVLQTSPEQTGERRPAQRLEGRVTLGSVSYRYDEKGPLVVNEVSLDIPAGSCVAIVGRSGSGKSTLAKLMLGLYSPTTGSIEYDGVSQAELDLTSLRRQLGVVGQASYVFGGTIRENLTLTAPDAPTEALIRAASIACIDADIQKLPLQYDAPVAEGGGSLSGGQRQRLTLARALVPEPAVLVLDEATSSLDATTEAALNANLEKLRCTRIVIAHRLSTVRSADLILVMEAGRVVERGRHDELMANHGPYSELVRTQLEAGGR